MSARPEYDIAGFQINASIPGGICFRVKNKNSKDVNEGKCYIDGKDFAAKECTGDQYSADVSGARQKRFWPRLVAATQISIAPINVYLMHPACEPALWVATAGVMAATIQTSGATAQRFENTSTTDFMLEREMERQLERRQALRFLAIAHERKLQQPTAEHHRTHQENRRCG